MSALYAQTANAVIAILFRLHLGRKKGLVRLDEALLDSSRSGLAEGPETFA